MPIGVRNLEWLFHNAERNYPLSIDATRLDTTETFTLPNDFLLSLYFPVHWGQSVDPGKFFLKELGVYSTGYSIVIGYDGSEGAINVASALIAKAAHTSKQSYNLGGLGDFADSRGHLVIGELDSIDEQPAGQFSFDFAGGKLDIDAIRPQIRGVMSIQVQNGNALSQPIYGHIRLKALRNFRITPVIVSGEDPILEFAAISGAGLNTSCLCDDEQAEPIRTINGIAADQYHNFNILSADECTEIAGTDNGILVKDKCSSPCCGCQELLIITQALEQFGDRATTLEAYVTDMESRVSNMEGVVLGSRLGDRACDAACP